MKMGTMAQTPSIGTAFWRGLRLRCAWCGSRRTFIRRWLGKYERCRTCGLRWRREEGFELGPVALNTVITFAVLAIGMLIGFVATYPDVAVGADDPHARRRGDLPADHHLPADVHHLVRLRRVHPPAVGRGAGRGGSGGAHARRSTR